MFTTKLNITRVIKRLLSLELEGLELEFRGLAESNSLEGMLEEKTGGPGTGGR